MLDTKLGHVFVFCCADVVVVIVVDDASNSGAAQLGWLQVCLKRLCFSCFQVMAKRGELLLHQEVKLRNKLVEYLTDWVLPSAEHHQSIPAELSVFSK